MTTIGLHAMKRRWLADTRRDGLCRDSAAWFLTTPPAWRAEGLPTTAAAVYLALSPAARRRLCAEAEPGAYVRLFRAEPDLLPALAAFADRPTGRETLHRYRWRAAAGGAVTAPYTKVARAGRTVGGGGWHTVQLGPDDVGRIEADLDRRPAAAGWYQEADLLERVECDRAGAHSPSPSPRPTKLGEFCLAAAHRLMPRLVAAGLPTVPEDPEGAHRE